MSPFRRHQKESPNFQRCRTGLGPVIVDCLDAGRCLALKWWSWAVNQDFAKRPHMSWSHPMLVWSQNASSSSCRSVSVVMLSHCGNLAGCLSSQDFRPIRINLTIGAERSDFWRLLRRFCIWSSFHLGGVDGQWKRCSQSSCRW